MRKNRITEMLMLARLRDADETSMAEFATGARSADSRPAPGVLNVGPGRFGGIQAPKKAPISGIQAKPLDPTVRHPTQATDANSGI